MKEKITEFATIVVDCLVYDRGEELVPRFVTIVGDTGDIDFVDDNGESSAAAKELIAQAMQTEAVQQGATAVGASHCVDVGGLPAERIAEIRNDAIYAFDEGSKLWLHGGALEAYMLEEKLLLKEIDMVVTDHLPTMGMRLGGEFREPIEQLIPLIVKAIVKLVNEKFPFMKTYTGLLMNLIAMYGGVNNIGKKYVDRIFEDVTMELAV